MTNHDIEARLRKKILDMHQGENTPSLTGAQLKLHLTLHLVIEKQLAAGSPDFVGHVVQALMEKHDLSRHEAIHRTFDVVSTVVLESIESGKYDEKAYMSGLMSLV